VICDCLSTAADSFADEIRRYPCNVKNDCKNTGYAVIDKLDIGQGVEN
jgi:hypothetical protein